MKLIDVTRQFATDDQCLDYIEKMRWPNGELGCVHCGEIGRISKITREKKSKNQRTRLYQCLACGKQFSATSGTIFNDSHLALTKWFLAIAMICEAKKGMSALQLQRHLGVNYRTAWYLCHRIREAMQEGGILSGVVRGRRNLSRSQKASQRASLRQERETRCSAWYDRTWGPFAPDSYQGHKAGDN